MTAHGTASGAAAMLDGDEAKDHSAQIMTTDAERAAANVP
jgi:hypothetical protein